MNYQEGMKSYVMTNLLGFNYFGGLQYVYIHIIIYACTERGVFC